MTSSGYSLPTRGTQGLPALEHLATRVRSWGPAVRAVVGSIALLGLVLGSVAIVLVADDRHSFLSPPSHAGFPAWMSGPLGGLLPHLTQSHQVLKVDFTWAVVEMYVCYLVVVACVKALRTAWVIGAIVAIHLVFLLSTPLLLTDVFNYLNYGRMGAVHGLNPYVHVPIAAHHDPAYRFSTWHHLRSPYGPLFTLITYALVPLGVAGSYWAFKAIVMLSSLACIGLVWKCAERLGRSPAVAVAFVAFNPLVLVFGLGGAHNDVMMLALVLAGVYLILGWRETLGGATLAVAVAIKASAGLLLPLALLGARRRIRATAGAAVASAALIAASLAVFAGHLPNDAAQSKLVVPFGLENLLGMALGLGGVTPHFRLILEAILVAGLLVSCVLLLVRRADWITAAGWVTLLLLLTLTWVMPWYVVWLLPFAALARSRSLRVATLAFGVFLMFNWLPLGLDFAHNTLHLKPTRTEVGRQNKAYVHSLLF